MKTSTDLLRQINWPPDGHYVVAVSGGVDSIVLLHLLATHWLHSESAQNVRRLRVAHLDHGMRSDSSIDRRLVSQITRIYDLPFHYSQAKLGKVSEDSARQARYRFLETVASNHSADAILTAHHLDDRQETSIFNLLRGSSRVGLAPMSSSQARPALNTRRMPVLRPLLKASKNELINYAKHHGLPWREDSTNTDLSFTRNFIRHELLPAARLAAPQFDTAYHQAINQLDQLNFEINHELDQLISKWSDHRQKNLTIPRHNLNDLNLSVLRHLLARLILRLNPDTQLSSVLLDRLALHIKSGKTPNHKFNIGQLWVKLASDTVVIGSGLDAGHESPARQLLALNTSVRFGNFELSIGGLNTYISDAIPISSTVLTVRSLKPGDRIAPVGMIGSKKLQDLFTDAKIPRSERLSYPVVESYNDEVVWVPGLAVSRNFIAQPDEPAAHYLTFRNIN